MLKERQKLILDAIIREHIKTARPVASKDLIEDFRLDFSPATIRGEMLRLDELGYLEQPHTSAGRIPTDQGYRFFVDHLVKNFNLGERENQILCRAFETKREDEFIKEFSRVVSGLSETFAAVGSWDEELFYETGFTEILAEPEFQQPEEIKTFGKFIDFLDERIRGIMQGDSSLEEKIFIGEENPLKEAKRYTMAFSSWSHPQGFGGFLTLVSPKRTNYGRQKAVLRSIKKIQNER
ncbi:MAG: hypothetical protein HYW91_03595 [Candidatus Sungbacteria bacterium]|nr:hypothetical protein [Candidatus Sungbacteria bacterium]